MGYYTRYKLSVVEGDVKDFEEKCGDSKKLGHYWEFYGNSSDSCKWYEHDEDMVELCKLFPGYVFKLYGEGEETGDLWVKYYKDGKVQESRPTIKFDEYDEGKLKKLK